MALLKIVNKKGKYHDPEARNFVINYILSPASVIWGCCGMYHVNPYDIVGSMEQTALTFGKTNGVKLRHFIISFAPCELNDPNIVYQIALSVACFFASEYQCVFAVHGNKHHLHIHIVINSISYIDGHRYYGTRAEYYHLRNFILSTLRPYRIYKLNYVSNKEP